MDADFDLYGDADIYGGAPADKQDEKKDEQGDEIDYLAEANDNGNAASSGNKRGRDDGGVDEVMQQSERKDMRYSSPGPSRNDTSGTYGASQSNQQSRPDYSNSGSSRMMEDTPAASDPSAARIALAGRPKVTDPNVQNALYIGELDWWVSDDDIRKIAQDVGIPISLSDVTFSEHKVNGKSKGVAYVEMSSEEEARALKTWFENNDINFKRAVVNLTTSANGNPFRTLPKDPPPRENRPPRGGMRGGGAGGQSHGGSSRGGRSDAPIPMAGAPIRMGSSTNGGGMNPMMNPMMMGMMGGGGGRPPFGGQANPMFMGANFGGQGGGMGRGGYGRGGGGRPPNAGMGHFNPNFFGMQGQGGMGGGGNGGGGGGGRSGGGREDQDRDRKRNRTDDNYY